MDNNTYLTKETSHEDIADAIREKLSEDEEYTPLEMPDKIRSIKTGDDIWERGEGSKSAQLKNSNSQAKGIASVAEGLNTVAVRDGAHTEGKDTCAVGSYSHAEGSDTTAVGADSHAEGYSTYASYQGAHSEGYETTSTYMGSHAEGYSTYAANIGSHSSGIGGAGFGFTAIGQLIFDCDEETEDKYIFNTERTISSVKIKFLTKASATSGFIHNVSGSALIYRLEDDTVCMGFGGSSSVIYTADKDTYDMSISRTTIPAGSYIPKDIYWRGSGGNSIGIKDEPNIAYGIASTTLGAFVEAHEMGEVAIGVGNIDQSNAILVAGNGTVYAGQRLERSNAMLLDRNGDLKIAGDIYTQCENDSTGGTKLMALPIFDPEEDEGKILGIKDGKLAWVEK